jgi:thiamine pyrophosphate-dependent acetolactate synthase large subunit-like protein
VPVVLMSRPGVPSAMTQMYNSFKDHIPMILVVDLASTSARGQDFFEEVDHMEEMPRTITKWQWTVEATRKIPEVFRRSQKFASTRPGGPVFLGLPEDFLVATDNAVVMDQREFDIPSEIHPDSSAISRAATLLLGAGNPLLIVGDEVTMQNAQPEVLELAELLALPTVRDMYVTWSMPMSNQHPLWLGQYLPLSRFPGETDVLLNLGSKMPLAGNTLKIEPSTQLIEISSNTTEMSRTYPTQVPILADLKIATRALIESVKQSVTTAEFKRLRDARFARIQGYTYQARETRRTISRERWNNTPISNERLAIELESVLERDTCLVSEVDSTLYALLSILSLGGAEKQYFANSGFALGYGLGAALGVKLALPNKPVVAVLGDGAFLFSGPQPLWSYARYRAPILVIVVNNHSYNNERNRMWAGRGRQFETGQDMTCYLGDPNISFARMAESFGVEAERVDDPAKLRGSLLRGKRATADGRPYLLDIDTERRGNGSASEWHSPFTIAQLRRRSV